MRNNDFFDGFGKTAILFGCINVAGTIAIIGAAALIIKYVFLDG